MKKLFQVVDYEGDESGLIEWDIPITGVTIAYDDNNEEVVLGGEEDFTKQWKEVADKIDDESDNGWDLDDIVSAMQVRGWDIKRVYTDDTQLETR
jgi:hypothetical protein